MTNHRNKQNYRFRTWKFRDRCYLKGGVRQGCFLSLILNNLIQYIHFHSLYIMSHYFAKFKENPCVGTDASSPFRKLQPDTPRYVQWTIGSLLYQTKKEEAISIQRIQRAGALNRSNMGFNLRKNINNLQGFRE